MLATAAVVNPSRQENAISAAVLERAFNPEPDDGVSNFSKWHGMSLVIDAVWDKVGLDGQGAVNGWATIALINGIDNVCERIAKNLDTISLVCGLLLSASLQMIISPPDALSELDDDSFAKLLYVTLMGLEITMHFTCIIMASLFSNSLNASARDSDRWRLLLKRGTTPTHVYILFTVGNFVLAVGIAGTLYVTYGTVVAVIFAVTVNFVCGVLMHVMNVKMFAPLSHVVHGWLKYRPVEFDLDLPFRRLSYYAKIDAVYQAQRTSAMQRMNQIKKPKYGCC